jgi:DNA-binding CsgD family transcriptional regulator/PAS domain-containing protein
MKKPMDQSEQFSALIGCIYDAGRDPTLWPQVLTKITDFVGGAAPGRLSKSSMSLDAEDPQRRSRAEVYSYIDLPRTLSLFDIAQSADTVSLSSEDPDGGRRLHQQKAAGALDATTTVLEKSTASSAQRRMVCHEARELATDPEMRRRMALIMPHVHRAVRIGKECDRTRAEAATFADVVDGLGAGVFLVDAFGSIVYANAAAHTLLHAGDLVRAIRGRLVAADTTTDRTLRDAIAAAGNGGAEGTAIPLITPDGGCHVAHIWPLATGRRPSLGAGFGALAALFVRKAAMQTPSSSEVIAKAYKLTPTEFRVLLAIVEVGGVPEVAAALGVAETTVKTHLVRLFDKTGSRRQADLVKLVAAFSSPLGTPARAIGC